MLLTSMADSRFDMIKKRHNCTFETALKQGKVDEQMQGLCKFIAGTERFYTSSCCSGRILLLEKRGTRKIDTFFHRKWHREISFEELLEGFNEPTKGEVWLKVDPFILHIGAKSLEDANTVLGAMKKAGVKRGGIIVTKPEKFLIEFQGTETMSVPVKNLEKKLVNEEYLRELSSYANALVSKNYRRLEKLGAELGKALKN